MTDEHFLRFVPRDFVDAYDELLDRSFCWTDSASGAARAQQSSGTGRPEGGLRAVKSGTVERSLRASPGGGVGKSGSARPVIRSEHALVFRQRVDRKIRKLTREMRVWLERGDARAGVRKCTNARCRRYAEHGWHYCPSCGYRTEEIRKT